MERVSFISVFGACIKDFCRKYLDLKLYRHEGEEDLVKSAFTKLLYDPSPEKQLLSSTVKSEITAISSIENLDEVIDQISKYYASYLDLMHCPKFREFLRSGDSYELQRLLVRAPKPQNYDDDLYSIVSRRL